MTHIITSLCLRDGACVAVCPVECIIAGNPADTWPWYYIDPDTCIDCGACIPECPYEAIFPEDEVPAMYTMADGQAYVPAHGPKTVPGGGTVLNLRNDIDYNYQFFKVGPGYKAKDM